LRGDVEEKPEPVRSGFCFLGSARWPGGAKRKPGTQPQIPAGRFGFAMDLAFSAIKPG